MLKDWLLCQADEVHWNDVMFFLQGWCLLKQPWWQVEVLCMFVAIVWHTACAVVRKAVHCSLLLFTESADDVRRGVNAQNASALPAPMAGHPWVAACWDSSRGWA